MHGRLLERRAEALEALRLEAEAPRDTSPAIAAASGGGDGGGGGRSPAAVVEAAAAAAGFDKTLAMIAGELRVCGCWRGWTPPPLLSLHRWELTSSGRPGLIRDLSSPFLSRPQDVTGAGRSDTWHLPPYLSRAELEADLPASGRP